MNILLHWSFNDPTTNPTIVWDNSGNGHNGYPVVSGTILKYVTDSVNGSRSLGGSVGIILPSDAFTGAYSFILSVKNTGTSSNFSFVRCDGEWHTYIVVLNGTNATLYVDGGTGTSLGNTSLIALLQGTAGNFTVQGTEQVSGFYLTDSNEYQSVYDFARVKTSVTKDGKLKTREFVEDSTTTTGPKINKAGVVSSVKFSDSNDKVSVTKTEFKANELVEF